MKVFEIRKNIGNNGIFVVYIIGQQSGHVWKTWDSYDFTERKLSNAIKRITKGHDGNCKFIRTF